MKAQPENAKGSLQLTELLARVAAGGILSALVAVAARRKLTLSASGAIAATAVGTLSIAAGVSWGALLLSFFVPATALSMLGESKKAARVSSVVEKGTERDAAQVLANAGVFTVAALGSLWWPSPIWQAIGAGALAASAADTWATEVGTLSRGDPIWILSGRTVPPGTSGGVTVVGTLAGLAGALFIAAAATLANWQVSFAAVALGGVAGAMTDSLLGATLQARRWCDVCAVSTERHVHNCGNPARHAHGLRGFDNDLVNAVCCGMGALVALFLSGPNWILPTN